MNTYEIVKKLIGSIEPYGDSSIDRERILNLKEHQTLSEDLVYDLIKTSRFKEFPESSMQTMGKDAHQGLLDIQAMINRELSKGV